MARKRDHKAEYQARKAKAKAAGYGNVTEYRKSRKDLRLPRTASPIPKRIVGDKADEWGKRRVAKEWSDAHSQRFTSKYGKDFTQEDLDAYWKAFVEEAPGSNKRTKAFARRQRQRAYLVPRFMSDEEWSERYGANPR